MTHFLIMRPNECTSASSARPVICHGSCAVNCGQRNYPCLVACLPFVSIGQRHGATLNLSEWKTKTIVAKLNFGQGIVYCFHVCQKPHEFRLVAPKWYNKLNSFLSLPVRSGCRITHCQFEIHKLYLSICLRIFPHKSKHSHRTTVIRNVQCTGRNIQFWLHT